MLVPLKILIVEDNPDDCELMVLQLEKAGFLSDWQRVDTEEGYLAALEGPHDLILSDWSLPNFSGLRALKLHNELDLDVPFIIVSGSIGEEAAVKALRLGADDYILKDRTARLGQAVQRALENKKSRNQRRQTEKAIRESEEKFRTLFEHAQDAIHIDNEKDEIVDVNARACELFGYSREELLGMKVSDLQAPEVRGQEGNTLQGEIDKYGGKVFEGLNQRKDGTKIAVEISVSKISTSQGIRFISIVRDISDRKRIEQELREQIDILERFNDVTVGRELKMVELKKEINALLEKAGEQEKYRILDI